MLGFWGANYSFEGSKPPSRPRGLVPDELVSLFHRLEIYSVLMTLSDFEGHFAN